MSAITSERIKDRRKSQQLNQQLLSQRTGISQAQISRYENGENEPTGEALVALANVLETTTDWLLGRSDALVTIKDQSGLDDDERQLIEMLRATDQQLRHRIMKAIKALLE